MKSYIKYDLFRSRRNFNPIVLFYKNNDMTYKEFEKYFNDKNVESPGFEYYNRVKTRFLEKKEEQDNIIEVKQEDVSIDIVKEVKPVKKRKKRKNKKNENN